MKDKYVIWMQDFPVFKMLMCILHKVNIFKLFDLGRCVCKTFLISQWTSLHRIEFLKRCFSYFRPYEPLPSFIQCTGLTVLWRDCPGHCSQKNALSCAALIWKNSCGLNLGDKIEHEWHPEAFDSVLRNPTALMYWFYL